MNKTGFIICIILFAIALIALIAYAWFNHGWWTDGGSKKTWYIVGIVAFSLLTVLFFILIIVMAKHKKTNFDYPMY